MERVLPDCLRNRPGCQQTGEGLCRWWRLYGLLVTQRRQYLVKVVCTYVKPQKLAVRGPSSPLIGRDSESAVLSELLEALRSGQSRALVVRGEPGVGKTALLEHLEKEASDCRVVFVGGLQSETELAFSVLHELCTPFLERLDALPDPQRDALRTTFGMTTGVVPDHFFVGLAVLGLLAEAAVERPLLCVVDDEQWLDPASGRLLAFVARRLGAESVGLVFGTRVVSAQLARLPELVVEGLRKGDACTLLDSALGASFDPRVRDQIVAETRGNPLALLELVRGRTPAQLAGGFGLPTAAEFSDNIEDSFRQRYSALPPDARSLVLVAAAEPLGEPRLILRAASRLGISWTASRLATQSGLVEFGSLVRFRHPLARSAVYHAASSRARQEVHSALAEVTDPVADPDRRVWHRAHAVAGPDDDVATELEQSAGRAQARGGLAAAAAFLERAAALTPDAARRAARALVAAQAKFQAGAFGAAFELLGVAQAGPLDELDGPRADLLLAQLAFAMSRGGEAPALLLKAAKLLEVIDAGLARATYLDAIYAAHFAGRLASPGADLPAVARAALAMPAPRQPTASDLLLEGLAANFTRGYAKASPLLRKALSAFDGDMPVDQQLRWLSLAFTAAVHIWDDDLCEKFSDRYLKLTRDVGAMTELPLALGQHARSLLFAGELAAAASVFAEAQAAADAMGSSVAPYIGMAVEALMGNENEASVLINATIQYAPERGEGIGVSAAELAKAVLNNGLRRYTDALAAAKRASEHTSEMLFSNWALVELVEAAARSGMHKEAGDAYRQLTRVTRPSGTDWGLGIEARSHALVVDDEDAENLFRESIERLRKTRVRSELARAHLLYGEWLRRQRRRGEARSQLRTAHELLEAMGMEAFAERARRELQATGTTTRKRKVAKQSPLTPQEAQIATLAREGLSNPEIGLRLFISARTVEYHLGKVFQKLGIATRSQLEHVLE
jgi:DNA-binding CsgD family transcriptional regulator